MTSRSNASATQDEPIEIEILGSNGVKTLKGEKIRSALPLKNSFSSSTNAIPGTPFQATHSPAAAGATALACANTAA